MSDLLQEYINTRIQFKEKSNQLKKDIKFYDKRSRICSGVDKELILLKLYELKEDLAIANNGFKEADKLVKQLKAKL